MAADWSRLGHVRVQLNSSGGNRCARGGVSASVTVGVTGGGIGGSKKEGEGMPEAVTTRVHGRGWMGVKRRGGDERSSGNEGES